MPGGYVGVDVFFVLSGYLITGILVSAAPRLKTHSYASYLADFYANRARRILPAAALTLVATDIAASYLLNLQRAHQVLVDGLWAAGFSANIHFAAVGTNYFAIGQPPSPLQHFWSLAVEEQFYIVWPLLVAVILVGTLRVRRSSGLRRRPISGRSYRGLALALLGISGASLVYAIYSVHTNSTAAYFSTPARVWELGLGGLLSLQSARLRTISPIARLSLGWLGLGSVAVASVVFTASTPFPGVAALLPTVGAAALIAAGANQSGPRCSVSRFLALAPLRFVGDRSYAFYLWHWPVLILATDRAGHRLSTGTNLGLLGGAFVVSCVTYALYENPLRRSQRLGALTGLALWPAALFAVGFVTAINWTAYQNAVNGAYVAPSAPTKLTTPAKPSPDLNAASSWYVVPSSPSAVVAAVDATRRRALVPTGLSPLVVSLSAADTYHARSSCIAQPGETRTQLCTYASARSSRRLVVLGDSHAQMWLPDIGRFGKRDGYRVIPLIKLSCSSVVWSGAGSVQDCRGWYKWAVAEVRRLKPSVLLLVTHYEDVADSPTISAQNVANVSAFVAAVRASVGRLIILGDSPGLRSTNQPLDCLSRPRPTMRSCSAAESQAELTTTANVAATVQGSGVFLDDTPWFCYAGTCPMVVGHTVVYVDTNHVTTTYASELAPLFRLALEQGIARGAKARRPRG